MDCIRVGGLGEESEGKVLLHHRVGTKTTHQGNERLATDVRDHRSILGRHSRCSCRGRLMSWPSVFAARFRGLFVKDRLERELDDEVRFHLEMQAEDNRRAGMNPAEARDAARRSFGGVEPMKETFRERRTFAWLETEVKDMTDRKSTRLNSSHLVISY